MHWMIVWGELDAGQYHGWHTQFYAIRLYANLMKPIACPEHFKYTHTHV